MRAGRATSRASAQGALPNVQCVRYSVSARWLTLPYAACVHIGAVIARALFLPLALAAAVPAGAQCLLCPSGRSVGEGKPDAPLQVEISAGLDFDRVALTAPGGGEVTVDPVGRGRTLTGAVTSLGGMFMAGSAVVRGEPGRAVRVELPQSVPLRTPAGSTARISRLVTDLPPSPRIGPDGTLRFSFGGRLDISGELDGEYRGRVEITVDYQ